MTHVAGVPVKISGVLCGTACIGSDGTIELLMDENTRMVKELLHQVLMGTVGAISIAPIMIPAVPAQDNSTTGQDQIP